MNAVVYYLMTALVTLGIFHLLNERYTPKGHWGRLDFWEIVFLSVFWPIGWLLLCICAIFDDK